jgi:hypothetical protein
MKLRGELEILVGGGSRGVQNTILMRRSFKVKPKGSNSIEQRLSIVNWTRFLMMCGTTRMFGR